ncbi:hypothetical protein AYO44_08595 [Planctomycetaceae bacterium SCGC AG-212-F19]|nr:hypothetical protein AYO44_08595 [Planctomycetaceae bacterium SCGC AG-212-F19]
MIAWMILLLIVGAGSYVVVSQFAGRRAAPTEAAPDATPPTPTAAEPATTPSTHDDVAARKKTEEEARQEAERQRLEAQRQKEEEAKRLADQKEKERLEQQAREEQRKKEEAAKKEAERLLVLKRNPKVTAALEDIAAAPDRFVGQYLIVERANIKLAAIERHKDLGRFTIGVTSDRGTYFSRVPLGGLVVSTSDKLGTTMQKQIDGTDNFYRFKLYCEIRKWGKKENTRTWPEVYIYKAEAYDRMGQLTRVMEE